MEHCDVFGFRKDYDMPPIAAVFFLFFFFIVISFASKSARKGASGNRSGPAGQNNRPPQTYGRPPQQSGYAGGMQQNAANAANAGQQTANAYRQQTVKVTPNTETNPMTHMHTGDRGDRCNTGYLLNESDHFDESAHPKLGNNCGIIARRHNDWDIMPQGYRVIKCCYCGAGNEVPVRRNGEYKCYFCWKKL